MSNLKNEKKTIKNTTSKKPKTITTNSKKKKTKKKKGFTLIELLAVIIILGILMIIAIPSVTSYISNSRKSSYIDTAKELISGARNMVNSGKLEMYDTDATYYIDSSCIKSENGLAKSPYGEFVNAYVVVTFDGKGYTYFWTSIDEAGQGVKDIIRYDKLDSDNIESDLKDNDISTLRSIDGRSKVINITSENDCKKGEPVTNNLIPISSDSGSGSNGNSQGNQNGNNNNQQNEELIVYPDGKDKNSVEPGSIVKIDKEEFYVMKHVGDDLYLLSRYNLNVGDNKYPSGTEGIQNSNVVTFDLNSYGYVAFSETEYWRDLIGSKYPGNFCTSFIPTAQSNCAYVYDENSNIYTYVNYYKNYLENLGVTIKNARLMSFNEASELGCGNGTDNCSNAPSWVYQTSYWLGSVGNRNWNSGTNIGYIWTISGNNKIQYIASAANNGGVPYGVRPVIVI